MSNENINLLEENGSLTQKKKEINLFFKNLISKYDFIYKSINFIIDNFPKEEHYTDNTNNLIVLFNKNNNTFYNRFFSIREKINLFIENNNLNENEKNNIKTEKDIIHNIDKNTSEINILKINDNSKIKEFFINYCNYINEIGNTFIEYSNNILKEIKVDNLNDSQKIINYYNIQKEKEKEEIKIIKENIDLNNNNQNKNNDFSNQEKADLEKPKENNGEIKENDLNKEKFEIIIQKDNKENNDNNKNNIIIKENEQDKNGKDKEEKKIENIEEQNNVINDENINFKKDDLIGDNKNVDGNDKIKNRHNLEELKEKIIEINHITDITNEEKAKNIKQIEKENNDFNEGKDNELNILEYNIDTPKENQKEKNKNNDKEKEENINSFKDNDNLTKEKIIKLNEEMKIHEHKKIKIFKKEGENIKSNIENIVEELIETIIKKEIKEQNIILKNIIKKIEKNIIDVTIKNSLEEKEKEKDKENEIKEKKEGEINKIEEEKHEKEIEENKNHNKEENKNNKSTNEEDEIEEKENIIIDISNKDEKISKVGNNEEIKSVEKIEIKNNKNINKSNELTKKNSNELLPIINERNIDSLLVDISGEEENINININKEKISQEIKDNNEENDIKDSNEKENINIKLDNGQDKNTYKKENSLDKEMKELIDLLNPNEISNNRNENKIEAENDGIIIIKNEKEKNNEIGNLDNKKINNEQKIEKNLDIKNSKKKFININNTSESINTTQDLTKENEIKINDKAIEEKEKNNIEKNAKMKKTETKEFDFDLDEEEDIDIIIKNKSNNTELKQNNENSEEKINKKNENIIKEKPEENKYVEINNNLQEKKVIENENIKKITPESNKNIIKKIEKKLILPLLPSIKDKEIYIESAIKRILSTSLILTDEYKTLNEILFNNESTNHFFEYFLNFFLKRINKKVRFISNEENFKMLIHIIENICMKEKRKYIFDSIIELTHYIKYENHYLYQYIRRNITQFKNDKFWIDLIESLLLNSLNKRTKYIINRENQKNENMAMTERGHKKSSSFWSDLFSFSFSKDEESIKKSKVKENENNSSLIIEIMGFSKSISNYNKLNYELKKELDDYTKKSLENILYKCIKYMSNLGFNKDSIKIIILNYCARCCFSNEIKEYFINLIDCYQYKNYILSKQNISLKNNKNIINDKSWICIISNIFIFLPIKERINLIHLNKTLYIKNDLKKEIFRKILQKKDLTLKNRLIIWEDLLNISKLKAKHNYLEIKESTMKRISSGEFQKGSRIFNNNETITKDVSRTSFLTNKIENQEKLSNILRCLNLINTSIGYYQGISYVGGFILQLLNFDEENTFFYMLGLETQTHYKELFFNNLEMLKKNFRIFDKILEIGLPEVFIYLDKYKAMPDFYTPSWFLTIFMCVSPIYEQNEIPKFCLLVFEKFILDGWDAVFNAGFTALKYYCKELIKTKEEMIFNYLTTDFVNKDIFKNSYFDIAKKDFIKNSEFISNELILMLDKICKYESQYKQEDP